MQAGKLQKHLLILPCNHVHTVLRKLSVVCSQAPQHAEVPAGPMYPQRAIEGSQSMAHEELGAE